MYLCAPGIRWKSRSIGTFWTCSRTVSIRRCGTCANCCCKPSSSSRRSVLACTVSPRKSRRKSACFSITVTSIPARASSKPSITPAGPPPAITQVVRSGDAFAGTRRGYVVSPGLKDLGWPGGRVGQLVGRRRTVAVGAWVRPAGSAGDAGGAGLGLRQCAGAGHAAGSWYPTDPPGASLRRRTQMSGMPRSQVTLVLVTLVVLVIVTWLLTH